MMFSKYKNRKTTYDGMTFDSKREADRYRELVLLQRSGRISELKCQVPFELVPAQYERYARFSKKTGKRLKDGLRLQEQAVKYVADFTYIEDGKLVVEDAKGKRTETYIIKRKLMLERHGIRIREV